MSELNTENINKLVDHISAKFHFKKVKNDVTGEETKRPTVEIDKFPVPSIEGIVAIFNAGGKGLDLLREAMNEVILSRGRELINENENLTAENFPYDQLSWDAIANLPKAERRGGGISKEDWTEFAEDYNNVMPAATGKPAEQIAFQSKIFLQKFAPVKHRKDTFPGLKNLLGIYINTSPNAENFQAQYEWLINKLDSLAEVDEAALLGNLGL